MRTCLDRLIAEPHVAGPRLKSESEYLAQRLEVCRLGGKISNDAFLDAGAIQGALDMIANHVDMGVAQTEIHQLLLQQLDRATRLEEKASRFGCSNRRRSLISMQESMLSLTGVGKSFKDVEALTHVDLEIHSGQVIGLVGGNGAGKTTLLRLMAGVLEPTKGNVLFKGERVSSMRNKLGVVPESTGLYSRLTAWENIRYHSRIYGVEDDVAWNRVSHFAKQLDLSDSLSRHTKGFSCGMRQKTALLRALAHGPDILLLDEPTAGLDVTSARTVRRLVSKLRDEVGLIYSTHHLAEAQQVCDRIVIVHNGTIRADGSPGELLDLTNKPTLEEAYVSLTSDKARIRAEDDKKESKLAKWWRMFLTGNTPRTKGVEEDE